MPSVGASVCSLLEPSRIDLVLALDGASRTSAELSKLLAVSRRATGRQLGILRASGLIYAEQIDHRPMYRLTPKGDKVLAGVKMIAGA